MNRIVPAGFAILTLWGQLSPPIAAAHSGTLSVATESISNREVLFSYRLPRNFVPADARAVMVVFGGRNWPGAATLRRIDFSALADRFSLILISPGFTDDEYWRPEKWSGRALVRALETLEQNYRLARLPLIYYGYSAGGQCANLFYCRNPDRIIALGVHACGVWGNPQAVAAPAPLLITCGSDDSGRREASLNFAQRAGEHGWRRIWVELAGGHELTPEVIALAECFFAAVLSEESEIFHGDDQSGRLVTPPAKYDPALTSILPGTAMRDKWLRLTERN